jgi:acyl carrier protein
MSQLEIFNNILKETFDVSDIKDDMSPDDIEQWDSITHMDLCAKFEDSFDISLDVEDIAEMETIGQIKAILRKYNVEL